MHIVEQCLEIWNDKLFEKSKHTLLGIERIQKQCSYRNICLKTEQGIQSISLLQQKCQ